MVRLIITMIIIGIVGGAIAYLGNQLGRYIGRKKLSIFRLRPRHTSILITTLTGVFIAGGTLLFAYLSSGEVQVLFKQGLSGFTQEVATKTLQKAMQADMGGVVYREREPILTAIIDGTKGAESTEGQLKEMLTIVNEAALKQSIDVSESIDTKYIPPADGRLVGYFPDRLKSLAYAIEKQQKKYLVIVFSMSYAFLGEKFPVDFYIVEYHDMIFKKDEEVIRGKVDGAAPKVEICTSLVKLSVQAKTRALRKGVIENPKTHELVEIDNQLFLNTIEEIAMSKKQCTVVIKSKTDVDTRGPLDIYFDVQPSP
ncbi:MAG: DUF3084 domain-containing protein [Vulcanimicrobiota bacterium]